MNSENRIIKTTIASAFLTALFWSIAIYVYIAYFTEPGKDNSVALGLGLMFSITLGFFVGGISGLIVGLTNLSVVKSLIMCTVFGFVLLLQFSIPDTMRFDLPLHDVFISLIIMLSAIVLAAAASAISSAMFNKSDET